MSVNAPSPFTLQSLYGLGMEATNPGPGFLKSRVCTKSQPNLGLSVSLPPGYNKWGLNPGLFCLVSRLWGLTPYPWPCYLLLYLLTALCTLPGALSQSCTHQTALLRPPVGLPVTGLGREPGGGLAGRGGMMEGRSTFPWKALLGDWAGHWRMG